MKIIEHQILNNNIYGAAVAATPLTFSSGVSLDGDGSMQRLLIMMMLLLLQQLLVLQQLEIQEVQYGE